MTHPRHVLLLHLACLGLPAWSGGYDFGSVFPAAEEWHAGGGPPVITDVYAPSGSSWWVKYPESDVFAYALAGTGNASGPFELRIGKGGQVYSIRAFDREWIPPQYRSASEAYGADYAPWVDEVFQPVAVNRALNTESNPYFIHGAGIYLKDPPVTDSGPFFSPLLAAAVEPAAGRLYLANWSQNPHVPTIYRSGLILFQRVTDRGQGIIEIEYILHNAGGDLLDYFNLPWGGVRRSNLPVHFVYNPDGTRTELTGAWGEGSPISITETAGFVSYAQNTNATSPSLAIVFGNRDPAALDGRWRKTNWRWGTAGTKPSADTPESDWRNYFVGATQVGVNLFPGESLLTRYFLVIGRESTTPGLVATHQLASRAGVWKLRHTPESAGLQPVYASLDGAPLEPVHAAGPDQLPWFSVAAAPVPGWRPLLVLEGDDGGKLLADDFYRLAHPGGEPATGFWRSYNGRTRSWRLLGFVPPDAAGIGQLGADSAAPLGGLLRPPNTLDGDFTRTLYAAAGPAGPPELGIHAGAAGLQLRHRVPVGHSYTLNRSDDLVDWQEFTGPGVGTNATGQTPLEVSGPAGAPVFIQLQSSQP